MDEQVDAPRSPRWCWTLWGLTTLTLLSLAWLVDSVIHKIMVIYIQMEIKSLPLPAEIILKWRDVVPIWLPPLAIAISGLPFVRRGDAVKTQRWVLLLLLLLILLASGMAQALFQPLVAIRSGGHLSNK
jgi:hypothetical protein